MTKKPTYKKRIKELDATIAKLTKRRKALATAAAKKNLDRIQKFFNGLIGTIRFVVHVEEHATTKALRRVDGVHIRLCDDRQHVNVTADMTAIREEVDKDGDRQISRHSYRLFPYLPVTWRPYDRGNPLRGIFEGKLVDEAEWQRAAAQVNKPLF